MKMTIFALRYEENTWKEWAHACDENEAAAIVESVGSFAMQHELSGPPKNDFYLEGARYIFDVMRGTQDKPVHGDTRVIGVTVKDMAINPWEKPATDMSGPQLNA